MLNLAQSYFAIPDPLRFVERCLNRYERYGMARINDRGIDVFCTARARRELQGREIPLIVELQLYFSCVIKKRVLFHRRSSLTTSPVDANLELAFEAVASAPCDPNEFAAHYPRGTSMSRDKTAAMVPRRVEIDYRQGQWEGVFYI